MTMRFFLAALALGLPAASAGVAATSEAPPGAALFARYCATCHGDAGQGDGPSAAVVDATPADLSGLSDANGGVFPAARVARRIDGRDALIAHGSPMPVYGAFFDGAPLVEAQTDEGPMVISLPVLEIVEYLRGLQR